MRTVPRSLRAEILLLFPILPTLPGYLSLPDGYLRYCNVRPRPTIPNPVTPVAAPEKPLHEPLHDCGNVHL